MAPTFIFFANISNLIAIQVENSIVRGDLSKDVPNEIYNAEFESENEATKEEVTIGDSFEHLMWFVQISDIHVSIFHDSTRVTELQEFCERTIPAINPSLVLATGDLTDAKTADNMGSAQQIEEWEIYRNILIESEVVNKTVWLDIRGNHDNFNIPTPDSKLNYYRNYTIQGAKNPHSYLYTSHINGDTYGFLGVDACLSPGPKRPFNFVGVLNKTEIKHVKHLIAEAKQKKVQYTIMFGHYPTSCIISEGQKSIRNIIVEAPGCWIYLCGHFHMLGGLVPNMYTLQKNGFLELELGDWKDNRVYRTAAIDHGLFSFIDTFHGEWPVMLITNPKHSLYLVPFKESRYNYIHSSHIRVLVFSLAPIELVQIQIDDGDWTNATNIKGPLYVVPWNPKEYENGVHNLNVRSRDAEGRERGITQPFCLDGTRLDFRFWPRVALMTNISIVFQSLFGMALCFCTVPLCIFKVVHVLVKKNKLEKPKIQNRLLRKWIRSFWILSTVDKIFYPLVTYPLYLSVGPWTIGEVIDGHIGAVFAWGLVVNNSYLPGSFTYAYGFLQMCSFQIPLTLVLAKAVDRRFSHFQTAPIISRLDFVFHHIPFGVVVCIQIICAYFFWLAYGTIAFFLGPLRTWSIILALVLWWICNNLNECSFREASKIWGKRRSENHTEENTCNL
ncbi:hypothetical protein RUM43_009893 [Polyplax serrata]|uniref:Calcineurin-like phosphoesterase domain-containing protein n=1 Tax=Polyplax serrata TaxID=468196 RepID=A0AAN8S9W0_POLSC